MHNGASIHRGLAAIAVTLVLLMHASGINAQQATASWSMLGATGSGGSGVCATTTAGDTYCWGQQAGPDGVLAAFPTPQRMTSQLPWYALATGASEAVCGIAKTAQGDAGADLYCWGSGRNGLFGVASTANYSATPIKVAWPDVPQAGDRPPNGGEIWYGVSIGARSACAVSASNQLYCWGLNDHGELGSGSTSPAGEVVREARRVGTSEMTFWDVSVGDGFACATGEYNGTWGKLWCWGSNEALQLGIADASLLQGTSTGGTNSVAGSSVNGFSATPLEIPLPSQLVDGGWHLLECGSTACCATAAAGDGPAYCWGGPFSSPTRRAPQAVPGGRRYKSDTLVAPFDVSAGDGAAQTQMACGTDIDDGYMYCWQATAGQDEWTQPMRVQGLPQAAAVQECDGLSTYSPPQVTGGAAFACVFPALNDTDPACGPAPASVQQMTVYCFGTNAFGQFGVGTNSNDSTATPVAVPVPQA